MLFRSRMTLDTLEHRDITQVNRVFERLVRLVTGFAFWLDRRSKVFNRNNDPPGFYGALFNCFMCSTSAAACSVVTPFSP